MRSFLLQEFFGEREGASSPDILSSLGTLQGFFEEIGEGSRRRIHKAGLHRAVCDYLAGMTDRYVRLEYERIFGETVRVGDDVRSL